MTNKAFSPEAYAERDLAILRHVGTYRISVEAAISCVVGNRHNLGHVIRRLSDDGLLLFNDKKLSGFSYVQLSLLGAQEIGVPLLRASLAIGTAAFDKAISVLAFCTLGTTRRFRIENQEAENILGEKLPTNQVHVVSDELGGPSIFRVQVAKGALEPLVRTLERDVRMCKKGIRAAVEETAYGFAVLCQTAKKKESIEIALQQAGLLDEAQILIEEAPCAASFPSFLKHLRAGTIA